MYSALISARSDHSSRASGARGVSMVEYMIVVGVIALGALVAYTAFGHSAQGLADREGECVRTFSCSDGASGGMPSGNGVANDPPGPSGSSGGASNGGAAPAANPTQAAIDHAKAITGGKTWQTASRAQQDEYVKYVQSLDPATAKAVFDENATRRGQEVDQSMADGLRNVVMNTKPKVNVDIFGTRLEGSFSLAEGFEGTAKTVPVALIGGSFAGIKGEVTAEAGYSTANGGTIAVTAAGKFLDGTASLELAATDKGATLTPAVSVGRDFPLFSGKVLGLGIGANLEVGRAIELPH